MYSLAKGIREIKQRLDSSEHRRPTDPVPCGERFSPYTGTTTHTPPLRRPSTKTAAARPPAADLGGKKKWKKRHGCDTPGDAAWGNLR